jgi:hypothetical protein
MTLDNGVALWAMHLPVHGIRDVKDALAAGVERVADLIDQLHIKYALCVKLIQAF